MLTPTAAALRKAHCGSHRAASAVLSRKWEGEVQDFTNAKSPVAISGPIATAFWLDPNRLLLSRETGEAFLVNPATGARLGSLAGHQTKLTATQLATHGRLATAEENGTLHIWNLQTGQELSRIGNPPAAGGSTVC